MTAFVLSTMSEAMVYLDEGAARALGDMKVEFSGELKTLEIEIEGALFDGRLTGEVARGLSELQDELYRAARYAITGKEGRDSRLTKSQKESLDLHIDVRKNCTLIKIDAGEFANGLLKILGDSAANMTPAQITGLVIGVVLVLTVGWIGKHAVLEHFKAKTSAIDQAGETERLKAATDAPVRVVEKLAEIMKTDARLKHFGDATAKGLTDVAVRATGATSVRLGRVELDQDDLANLTKRSPKMMSESLDETGYFRIMHVDASSEPFKLTLSGDVITGEFEVEYEPADFTPEQDEKIWAAAKTRGLIWLSVKAVQLRDKIKGAVLVDIEPPL